MDGAAPGPAAFRRRIRERLDARMGGEHGAYALTLHTDALAMNEAHVAQPLRGRRVEVVRDHLRDLAWLERVEIEVVLDRHRRRLLLVVVVVHGSLST